MKNHLPGSYISVGGLQSGNSTNRREPLVSLFAMCNGAMQYNNRVFLYNGQAIRVQPHWVRDHILTTKSSRYIEEDLTSFLDLLLDRQHERGFFYEILAPIGNDQHSGFRPCSPDKTKHIVDEPYRKYEPPARFGLCRLELEADIEYLMVEGCYLVWQATGDDAWLMKQLPRLEEGLLYLQTDPVRWDEKYQLVKRPHTLDTWDFTDRASSAWDRMIRPEDPMGIFHGDNTGLVYAKKLLAKTYRYFGEEAKAAQHDDEAEILRERIMKLLWNGQFFRHFLMLDPADYGVDETYQLSLSNSYALNRDILTLDERRTVIGAYRACRKKYQGELDDFRNLEPPFPVFMGKKAGEYVNGGNAPFVAGQLAVGAFNSGEEEYGADIIDRIGCKFLRDGKISFLYDWDEKDIGGGPRCWSGAEIMYAMAAGLAGVVDNTKLFEDVTISPRFAAAKEDLASVRLKYAASGSVCEYDWASFDDQRQAVFTLMTNHKEAKLRMYAPKGTTPVSVKRNGQETGFSVEKVFESKYAVLDHLNENDRVEVAFC